MPKAFSRTPVWRVSSAAIKGAVLQRLARAAAEIAQIADRRRDDIEPPADCVCHYNPRLYRDSGAKGMAAISRRPRLALLAALALSLMLAACSLVKHARSRRRSAGAAARLAQEGKHAEAAQAYAGTRRSSSPRTTTTISC